MEYIFGVIASLLVKALKTKFKTDGIVTGVILVAVSLIGAGVYVWLEATGYWGTLAQILVTAGAFHNFILRPLTTSKQ